MDVPTLFHRARRLMFSLPCARRLGDGSRFVLRLCVFGLTLWSLPLLAQASVIEYREVFGTTSNVGLSNIGWYAHQGATAIDLSSTTTGYVAARGAGRPNNLSNVNAGPTGSTTLGYGAKTSTGSIGIAWTDEHVIDRSAYHVNQIRFQLGNTVSSDELRVAVRIGGDWYASSSVFQRGGGNGGNFDIIAQEQTLNFASAGSNWRNLNFTPGSSLSLGSGLSGELPSGNLTGFGLYNASNASTLRFDTFEIEVVPLNSATVPITLSSFKKAQTLDFESYGPAGTRSTISGTDPLFTEFGITQVTATGGRFDGGGNDTQNQTAQSGKGLFFTGGSLWVLPQDDASNGGGVDFGFNQTFTLDFDRNLNRFGLTFQDQIAQDMIFRFFLDGVLQGTISWPVEQVVDTFYGFQTPFWFDSVEIDGSLSTDGFGIDNITIEAVPEPSAYLLVLLGLGTGGWWLRRRR